MVARWCPAVCRLDIRPEFTGCIYTVDSTDLSEERKLEKQVLPSVSYRDSQLRLPYRAVFTERLSLGELIDLAPLELPIARVYRHRYGDIERKFSQVFKAF